LPFANLAPNFQKVHCFWRSVQALPTCAGNRNTHTPCAHDIRRFWQYENTLCSSLRHSTQHARSVQHSLCKHGGAPLNMFALWLSQKASNISRCSRIFVSQASGTLDYKLLWLFTRTHWQRSL
jgi:hypothetical protein